MREVERLRSEVQSTVGGDPWYGPSVLSVLQGVDAAAAAARPIPGAHSVWELVLHMTAWARETARRLGGGSFGNPVEGDWPPVVGTDSIAWEKSLAELRRAHDELSRTFVDLQDGDLGRLVGGTQTDALGEPVTLHRTMIGILQHDAYHTGQVALLKKLLPAPATSDPRLGPIGQIAVPVGNLERAIAFYRDVLGMRFLFQAPPGLGFFDCAGVRLMLDAPLKAQAESYSSVIYYKVLDLKAAFEALSARGVHFEAKPHRIAKLADHELWMAFFRDPDRNLLALMSEVPV